MTEPIVEELFYALHPDILARLFLQYGYAETQEQAELLAQAVYEYYFGQTYDKERTSDGS